MSNAPQGVEVQIGTRAFPFWWKFTPFWTGRAFPINATCMVTCDHVVQRAQPKNFRFPAYPNMPPVEKVIRVENIHDLDMAIIVFAKPHGLTPVTLAAQNPAADTPIAFTNRYDRLCKGRVHGYFSHADILQAIVTAGIVPTLHIPMRMYSAMHKSTRKDLLCSLSSHSGDSGSPVYNEQGEVVGMLFACSKLTYQTMLVPVETLREHIDKQLADQTCAITC